MAVGLAGCRSGEEPPILLLTLRPAPLVRTAT